MVKIKSRNEILKDVIRDGKKYPKDWNAIFGMDNKLLSKDCYIFHPNIGVYFLKEYQKNPFEIKGLGGKIERQIDEDIEVKVSKYAGDFGIIQGDFKKILKNLDKGIQPEKILDAAIKGKEDLGISVPVRGHASASKDVFNNIHNTLSVKQKKLNLKFEKMASDDGLYNSYD